MRKLFSKIAFTAILAFATTFTLSCGEHAFDELLGSSSSSDGGDYPSSSGIAPSSSSIPGSSVTTPSSSSLPSSSSSQAQAIVPVYGDSLTDSRDGQTYETVVIGTQTWMAKNLNFETETGSRCYNDNTLNCTLYGRLYNWAAAMNACPAGWHLPSDFEWVVLEDFIGGSVKDAWKKLRAKSGWISGSSGNGTDDYGFNALPEPGSGYGYWWTSTENHGDAYYRNQDGMGTYGYKSYVHAVRCLKGDKYVPPSSPYTPVSCPNVPAGGFCDDRDGKGYKSVTIDGKIWMAENLNFNAEGSKCYNNDPANCAIYGRLYDWATAMAFESACNKADCSSYTAEKHKGICPTGWHVPNDAELNGLVTSAGGSSTAGRILKATSGWTDSNGNPAGNGADLLGFSALPSGYCSSLSCIESKSYHIYGSFSSRDEASHLGLGTGDGVSVNTSASVLYPGMSKSYFYSLRCVQD